MRAQAPATQRRRSHRPATCLRCAPWSGRFRPAAMVNRDRLHGSHRARRTAMQPVQLSLLPDQVPAPPPAVIARLPEADVGEAVRVLAALIARMAGPPVPAPGRGAGD